jgi:hypothetical protein
MCEYSLESVGFQPAKVGDKLVTVRFPNSLTYGFAQLENVNVAVCLLQGTELAFGKEVECRHPIGWLSPSWRKLGAKVARFQQINLDKPWAHHDVLEFPDGGLVLLTRLCPGQRATVLQLPVQPATVKMPPEHVGQSAQNTSVSAFDGGMQMFAGQIPRLFRRVDH